MYYRFLLLLMKPFWFLTLSILSIIIIRIFFIKIVHAGMDCYLFEKFPTGYYSYRTPLDEIFVFDSAGELVGRFSRTLEYSSFFCLHYGIFLC